MMMLGLKYKWLREVHEDEECNGDDADDDDDEQVWGRGWGQQSALCNGLCHSPHSHLNGNEYQWNWMVSAGSRPTHLIHPALASSQSWRVNHEEPTISAENINQTMQLNDLKPWRGCKLTCHASTYPVNLYDGGWYQAWIRLIFVYLFTVSSHGIVSCVASYCIFTKYQWIKVFS